MAELGILFVPLWNFPFHKILSLLHAFFLFARNWIYSYIGFFSV